MIMTTLQRNEKSMQLLRAILDMFTHPAWITDDSGIPILCNTQAEDVIHVIPKENNQSSVSVQGRKFKLSRREMNHGTNCILHELQEDPIISMKEATNRLAILLASR